jgi:hypothetical protein
MTPATVRLISDGEEMVLFAGEASLIQPEAAPDAAVGRKGASVAPKPLALQYLGFQNVGARREYLMQAGRGDQASRYVVWIELAAFSERRALLQDGPDICYQKLLRELAGAGPPGPEGLGVTEVDLAAYRATHTTPARHRWSASATPAPGQATQTALDKA